MQRATLFFTKLGITAVAALLLTSCEFNGISGSGNITVENRSATADFQKIEAGNGLDIYVEQSPNVSIIVEADDNVQKHITTRIENGTLYIKSDCNSYSNVTKTITVKMPIISSINVESGANLDSKNTLKSNAINIKSSSGANVKISIETEKATCEASSGSNMEVSGKAIDLETASSSGSSLNAEDLLANTIKSSASSGSTTEVHPLVSLNAEASSGSNINYHNTPKNIHKRSSSGGSVNQE